MMDSLRTVDRHTNGSEVNLKTFFKQLLRYKFLFLISLAFFIGLAFLYNKIATPIYEVGTSILIDPSGKSRSLGESQYVGGSVSQIDMEKNIFNEIGILKSFALVKKTLEELDYGVRYSAGTWYKMEEMYGYFPFEVEVLTDRVQLYSTPFEVEILNDETYSLMIDANEFYVTKPDLSGTRKVEAPIEFAKKYQFGEVVEHEYFSFIIHKPKYKIYEADFEGKDLIFELQNIEDLTNAYLDKLEVYQSDIQASIVQLKTQGAVLDKEIDFLSTLTSNYMAVNLDMRSEIAEHKENFIKEQLGSITDSLETAEAKIERFRRRNNAVDIDRTLNSSVEQLRSLETELNQIELNNKYYRQILSYIKSADSIDKVIAPSAAGINDPLLNENILDLKNLYAERTRKRFYKGEKSYDLVILDQQIENTTKSLTENIRNLIRVNELGRSDKKKSIAKIEQSLKHIPKSEIRLGSHERKSDLYENLYKYLSQELAETGIARAENMSSAQVLDAPRMLGNEPISPQKKLIYLLGGLLGLLFPLAWVILANAMNTGINDLAHLEQISPIPVAASIVHAKGTSKIGFSKDNQWQVEESFRDLNASLQFLVNDNEANVIGMTSTISGEGKTFCTTNLALAIAHSGKRVLVIDTDFRNPSLFQDISEGKSNLTDYLKRKTNYVEQIIHKHPDNHNLNYIPIGKTAANPQELLSNTLLTTMIGELQHHYDYVLIDTPAVGLVSDYLLLSKYIDVHLFVLRHKVSKLPFLDELLRLKEKGRMEETFLVYNDVPVRSYKNGLVRNRKNIYSQNS